jgi:hypothetical protein
MVPASQERYGGNQTDFFSGVASYENSKLLNGSLNFNNDQGCVTRAVERLTKTTSNGKAFFRSKTMTRLFSLTEQHWEVNYYGCAMESITDKSWILVDV